MAIDANYPLPIGTRVKDSSNKWHTVISHNDKRYTDKFGSSGNSEWTPVVGDLDEHINGFLPHAIYEIQLPGELENPNSLVYREVIKDEKAQAILKTFMAELYILLSEYDMIDTIFGDKVEKLMDSWSNDMNA